MDQQDNNKNLTTASQSADVMAKVQLSMTDEVKLAHEMLGRQQMASSLRKLLTVADLVEIERIKESKAWRHIANPEMADGSHFSAWPDFCRLVFGESHQSINEKLLNKKVFGEDAINSMNTIGLGVRQLRQLRQLPEDQLEQAKLLATENDKESLMDLIEEQALEKAKLKEALEKSEADAKLDAEASSNLIEKKDKKLNELKTKLEKRAIEPTSWEAEVDEISLELTLAGDRTVKALDNLDLLLDKIPHLELAEDHREAAIERLASNVLSTTKQLTIKIDTMMTRALADYGMYDERMIPSLDHHLVDDEA